MKNFSELLDIDYDIPVCITIKVITDNGIPNICATLNNIILYNDCINDTIHIEHMVDLLEPICISVEMSNKIYDEHKETAVIIENIVIDGIEYIPKCNHMISYENDHDIKDLHTNYMGYNGRWVLDTIDPYYVWKHHMSNNGWLITP